MKINNNNMGTGTKGVETPKADRVDISKSKDGGAAKPTVDVESASKLNFSNRAQDIKKAKELASKGLNDVDEAKVAKFQKLIDEGKYKVDADAIADKMVDEHLMMGN
ncbi:MAG: flagellar biosynthesis anti-sigma factor FlgM [Pseudobdellovibrionaceae bacterium]